MVMCSLLLLPSSTSPPLIPSSLSLSLSLLQSSASPSYSHLLLLELGIQCPTTALLEFEVFSVNYSQTDDKDKCQLVGSTQETGAPVSDLLQ